MALRKKQSQVSTLHVVHHAAMPLLTWLAKKIYLRPAIVSVIILNTLAHMFMYTYYFLAISSICRKNMWFKKYITACQITQFNILLVQYIYMASSCLARTEQYVVSLICLVFLVYMDIAFINFYLNNYVFPKKFAGHIKIA